MTIALSKLEKYFVVEKLIFHSVDLSLYQVSAIIDGQEHYISDDKNILLRSINLIELQKLLQKVSATETVLRQTSAYDEMIGGSEKPATNALQFFLADTHFN